MFNCSINAIIAFNHNTRAAAAATLSYIHIHAIMWVSRCSSAILFRFYVKCFQLLGQCPVVFKHSKKFNSKVLTAISYFHVIVTSVVVLFVYLFKDHILYNGNIFGQFNDVLLYSLVILAYYGIVIESYVKREIQSKMWNSLAQHCQSERLDEGDQCKLWNCKEFTVYFFGLCLRMNIGVVGRMKHYQRFEFFLKDISPCSFSSNSIGYRSLQQKVKLLTSGRCTSSW